MGVEPTAGVLALPLDLKSRRDTGPHALPLCCGQLSSMYDYPGVLTVSNRRPESSCQGFIEEDGPLLCNLLTFIFKCGINI